MLSKRLKQRDKSGSQPYARPWVFGLALLWFAYCCGALFYLIAQSPYVMSMCTALPKVAI